MSEVRGKNQDDPMPEGQWPKGVTPRPRSGAAAESARLRGRRNGREELPRVRGQWWPGGDTPRLRSGAAGRSHLALEAKGGDPEEPPTPEARASGQRSKPRSGGCAGAGGPRGAIPC